MKMGELRQKSTEELRAILEERERRSEALKALLPQKKVKNVKERVAVKKDIARMRTLLRERRNA